MRLELYQAETSRIAKEQTALLDEAQQTLASGKKLSRLEENGVLHALQVLIENSIGNPNIHSKLEMSRYPFLPMMLLIVYPGGARLVLKSWSNGIQLLDYAIESCMIT